MTSSTPLRVAIVGAGPAGFYAADRLLRTADLDVEVELFDRIPTPWGLVRAGVAPDHPNIKAVTRVYEKTAALPGFRFHGNVDIGTELSHEDLTEHHHAVIYTVGASLDRKLGIPGEDLIGSHSATDFVAWYNGHPDGHDFDVDLSAKRVVVVGNGNVAIDVARMLVLPREELAVTDVADHALEALSSSSVEEVIVLGRRGPAQAAFTNPEAKELGELTDADIIVDPAEVALDDASAAWLASDAADKTARVNVDLVTAFAGREPTGKPKRVVLRFCASPVEIIGSEHVEGVRIVHNELVASDDGSLRAKATGQEEVIECGLVLRSVGYRGRSLVGVPFDDSRYVIPNVEGRVLDAVTGEKIPGLYTAGWIKRGPSGVIGTNKKCANETIATLLADLESDGLPEPPKSREAFDVLLDERCPKRVDYEKWGRIDAHERAEGEAQGRPRVKLVKREDLINKAHS